MLRSASFQTYWCQCRSWGILPRLTDLAFTLKVQQLRGLAAFHFSHHAGHNTDIRNNIPDPGVVVINITWNGWHWSQKHPTLRNAHQVKSTRFDGKKDRISQAQISSSFRLAVRGWWKDGRGQHLTFSTHCLFEWVRAQVLTLRTRRSNLIVCSSCVCGWMGHARLASELKVPAVQL